MYYSWWKEDVNIGGATIQFKENIINQVPFVIAEPYHFPFAHMHSIRLSLLSLATLFSIAMPVATSACGGLMKEDAVMMTPVSMRGAFVFTTRVSRRHLRKEIAERQNKEMAPLIGLLKEIL